MSQAFDPDIKHTGLSRLSNIEAYLITNGKGGEQPILFSHAGSLSVAAGTGRCPVARACVITGVVAATGTAPTGASLVCDVNQNGTTVFTSQANRPSIAAGANVTSMVAVPDVTQLAAGDVLSVDIDAVGSSTAGADLTVVVLLKPV